MEPANKEIRSLAKENHIHFWQIAYRYGCNDSSFSRKLRFELPAKEKKRIISIINQIIKEKVQSN